MTDQGKGDVGLEDSKLRQEAGEVWVLEAQTH